MGSGSFFTPPATPEVFFPFLDSPDPIQADPALPPAPVDDDAIAEGLSPSENSKPLQQTSSKNCAEICQKKDPKSKEEKAAYAREYRQIHKDEIAAHRRIQYQMHRDEILSRNQTYRQSHAEEILAHRLASKDELAAYDREYYKIHRIEKITYAKAHRQANREEILAAGRIYNKTHKDEIAARRRQRQARTAEDAKTYVLARSRH